MKMVLLVAGETSFALRRLLLWDDRKVLARKTMWLNRR